MTTPTRGQRPHPLRCTVISILPSTPEGHVSDFEFRDEVGLAGVNSINWGTGAGPKCVYSSPRTTLGAPDREVASAAHRKISATVFAGQNRKRWALPSTSLVVATTKRYPAPLLRRATYAPVRFHPSMQRRMDIQVSSISSRAAV